MICLIYIRIGVALYEHKLLLYTYRLCISEVERGKIDERLYSRYTRYTNTTDGQTYRLYSEINTAGLSGWVLPGSLL